MRIRFKCHQCRTSMYIAAHKRGLEVKCLACGAETRVPSVDAPRKAPVLRSTKVIGPNRKRAIACLAGGAAAIVFVLALGVWRSRPAETIKAREAPTPTNHAVVRRAIEVETLPMPVRVVAARIAEVKTEAPLALGLAEVRLPKKVEKVAAGLPEFDDGLKVRPSLRASEPVSPRVDGPKLARGLEQVFLVKLPVFKPASEEELRRQLNGMPEVGLHAGNRQFLEKAELSGDGHPMESLLTRTRFDLKPLPFRFGADCESGVEYANYMGECSTKLRGFHFPDVMDNENLNRRQAIPTMMQMLTSKGEGWRMQLVETLGRIDHRDASAALAKLAIFDLSEEVRAAAVTRLQIRPREEFEDRLTRAFAHPWPAAANHAAQALVALKMAGSVPTLKKMLDLPDPTAAVNEGKELSVVRELVRVNHLKNCLLCHQRSTSQNDLVRGVAPDWSRPLESVAYYQGSPVDVFVRADIVYLRQDFSVVQPVAKPGPWPAHQRFDYVVQTRPATIAEMRAWVVAKDLPQHEALRFAISALTSEPELVARR